MVFMLGVRSIFNMKRYIKSDITDILDEPKKVQQEVALAPNTRITTLLRLTASDYFEVRRSLASRKNKPIELIKRLAHDPASIVRQVIANDEETPTDILIEMLNDKDNNVRCAAVLANPNLPLDYLIKAAYSDEDQARTNVAYRDRTPVEILEYLAKDPSPQVREAVATNPKTPALLVKELYSDDNSRVSQAAKARLIKEGVTFRGGWVNSWGPLK